MINTFSRIELHKEDMKFSAGHFTIFSDTERENLHGHNFFLHAAFVSKKTQQGLSFDYRFYKEKLRAICKQIDEVVIMPGLSQHISISETNTHYEVIFNKEKMHFLKRDMIVLPITNVTVEELSGWFIQQLTVDRQQLLDNQITAIHVKIQSSPGQSGESSWELINE